jgi:hypothetical protein
MATKTKTASQQLLFDSASGQYIPKRFATEIKREAISGVDAKDLDYLAHGPGGCLDKDVELYDGETIRGEYYWDTWQTILDNAVVTDSDGNEFNLYQDGDVWLVPTDWEWCDATESFRPPESDTLRRYELPAYWASAIFNGDESGLRDGEAKQIVDWMTKEDLLDWTPSEVGESYFSHSNDATNLGGDVSEYTFVKI